MSTVPPLTVWPLKIRSLPEVLAKKYLLFYMILQLFDLFVFLSSIVPMRPCNEWAQAEDPDKNSWTQSLK